MEEDNNNNNNVADVVPEDDDSVPVDPNQLRITLFTKPGVTPKFDVSKYPPPKDKKKDDEGKCPHCGRIPPSNPSSDEESDFGTSTGSDDDLQLEIGRVISMLGYNGDDATVNVSVAVLRKQFEIANMLLREIGPVLGNKRKKKQRLTNASHSHVPARRRSAPLIPERREPTREEIFHMKRKVDDMLLDTYFNMCRMKRSVNDDGEKYVDDCFDFEKHNPSCFDVDTEPQEEIPIELEYDSPPPDCTSKCIICGKTPCTWYDYVTHVNEYVKSKLDKVPRHSMSRAQISEHFHVCRLNVYQYMHTKLQQYGSKRNRYGDEKRPAFPMCVETEVKNLFPDPYGIYNENCVNPSLFSTHGRF